MVLFVAHTPEKVDAEHREQVTIFCSDIYESVASKACQQLVKRLRIARAGDDILQRHRWLHTNRAAASKACQQLVKHVSR